MKNVIVHRSTNLLGNSLVPADYVKAARKSNYGSPEPQFSETIDKIVTGNRYLP